MSERILKDTSRFYEVAHEFSLIVEGETHFTREERRGKAFMKDCRQMEKEFYK